MPRLTARHYVIRQNRCRSSLPHDELLGLHCLSIDEQVAEIDAIIEVGHREGHMALHSVQLLSHHFLAEQVVDASHGVVGCRHGIVEAHRRRGWIRIGMAKAEHWVFGDAFGDLLRCTGIGEIGNQDLIRVFAQDRLL